MKNCTYMCRSQKQYYSPISDEIQRLSNKRSCVERRISRFLLLLLCWQLFSLLNNTRESLMNYTHLFSFSFSFASVEALATLIWNHTTEIFELFRRLSHFYFIWLIWSLFFYLNLTENFQFSFLKRNNCTKKKSVVTPHVYLFLSFLSHVSFVSTTALFLFTSLAVFSPTIARSCDVTDLHFPLREEEKPRAHFSSAEDNKGTPHGTRRDKTTNKNTNATSFALADSFFFRGVNSLFRRHT